MSQNRYAASGNNHQNPTFLRGVCYYKGSFKICNFAIMAKAKKKRADKYDSKLAINGSFEDVIKVMVTPGKPATAPKPVKPKKK
jgi:hypothetical protein